LQNWLLARTFSMASRTVFRSSSELGVHLTRVGFVLITV
jgi:hypothetical protein